MFDFRGQKYLQTNSNLHPPMNHEILKPGFRLIWKTWLDSFQVLSEKWDVFLEYFENNTPGAASGGAPRALPRPGMGVYFPNVLKTDPQTSWKWAGSSFQNVYNPGFSKFRGLSPDASYQFRTNGNDSQRHERISKLQDFDEVWSDIMRSIDEIVHTVKPRKLILLAIDGVAPRAKMNQ